MRTTVILYIVLGSILVIAQHQYQSQKKRLEALAQEVRIHERNPAASNPSAHAKNSLQNDHAAFEAITGDSADEDKNIWDTFYKNKNFIYGKDAIGFLKTHIQLIPAGKAFVPAMGEGRNAIYLAKKGFTVIGNDISEVAVDKALAEAKAQHVTIQTNVIDLKQYPYKENSFDFILVSLFYDKDLLPSFKKALKKGGYIMFYNKVEVLGAKENSPDDFAVKPAELKDQFKDYQTKVYQEYSDHGMRVVGLLARKP